MLSGPLVLLLELPPLAFGPALPPPAFQAPRELTCALGELGRIQTPAPVVAFIKTAKSGDVLILKPPPEARLVNPLVDPLLMLAIAIGADSSWDERTWLDKAWNGAAPVLIPPQQVPRSLRHLGSPYPNWSPPMFIQAAER